MPGDQSVLDLCGSVVNAHHVRDLPAAVVEEPPPLPPRPVPPPEMGEELLAEGASRKDIQRRIDRLRGDALRHVPRILRAQTCGDLFR